jgi:hypothetical protein
VRILLDQRLRLAAQHSEIHQALRQVPRRHQVNLAELDVRPTALHRRLLRPQHHLVERAEDARVHHGRTTAARGRAGRTGAARDRATV